MVFGFLVNWVFLVAVCCGVCVSAACALLFYFFCLFVVVGGLLSTTSFGVCFLRRLPSSNHPFLRGLFWAPFLFLG